MDSNYQFQTSNNMTSPPMFNQKVVLNNPFSKPKDKTFQSPMLIQNEGNHSLISVPHLILNESNRMTSSSTGNNSNNIYHFNSTSEFSNKPNSLSKSTGSINTKNHFSQSSPAMRDSRHSKSEIHYDSDTSTDSPMTSPETHMTSSSSPDIFMNSPSTFNSMTSPPVTPQFSSNLQIRCHLDYCKMCSNGSPLFLQKNPTWANIMRVVFYTLKENCKEKIFFNLKTEVYNFMTSHWDTLCINRKRSDNWKKQIQDMLSHSKDMFESGMDHFKQNGFWRLKIEDNPWEMVKKKNSRKAGDGKKKKRDGEELEKSPKYMEAREMLVEKIRELKEQLEKIKSNLSSFQNEIYTNGQPASRASHADQSAMKRSLEFITEQVREKQIQLMTFNVQLLQYPVDTPNTPQRTVSMPILQSSSNLIPNPVPIQATTPLKTSQKLPQQQQQQQQQQLMAINRLVDK